MRTVRNVIPLYCRPNNFPSGCHSAIGHPKDMKAYQHFSLWSYAECIMHSSHQDPVQGWFSDKLRPIVHPGNF